MLFLGRIFVVYTESDAEKAVAYLKDQRIVGWIRKTRPTQRQGTAQGGIIANSYSGHLFSVQENFRIGMPDSLQSFWWWYPQDGSVTERWFQLIA